MQPTLLQNGKNLVSYIVIYSFSILFEIYFNLFIKVYILESHNISSHREIRKLILELLSTIFLNGVLGPAVQN